MRSDEYLKTLTSGHKKLVITTPYTCRVASIYESKLVDFWTKLNDVVHKKVHSYPRVMRLATAGTDVSEKFQNLPQ